MKDFLRVFLLLDEDWCLKLTKLIEFDGFLEDGATLSLQVLGRGSAICIGSDCINSILSGTAGLLLGADDLHQRGFELIFCIELR